MIDSEKLPEKINASASTKLSHRESKKEGHENHGYSNIRKKIDSAESIVKRVDSIADRPVSSLVGVQ